MSEKRRNILIVAGSVLIVVGVAAYFVAVRNDPMVRLTEVECQAAQKAYDTGQEVLLGLIRDCERSGYPIER